MLRPGAGSDSADHLRHCARQERGAGGGTRSAPARIALAAKVCVPIVALVALFLLFQGASAIVSLLLGYEFVTQLLPSMLMSLRRNNPITATGATAGMATALPPSRGSPSARRPHRTCSVCSRLRSSTSTPAWSPW